MGEFGWAYVAGGAITGALGPTGSVLLKTGPKEISGSSRLLFDTSTYTLELSGNIYVSGAISGSTITFPDLVAGNAVASKYLALDAANTLIVTSSGGQGGGGGINYSRTAVTQTMTASISDTILGVSANASIDIRLSPAQNYQAGQYFTVKDEGGLANSNPITIVASGSQTIDGQSSIIIESPYAAVNIYSDGTSKFFIY